METQTIPTRRGWDWSLVLVTLVAAVPRLYRPGMYGLWWDEVTMLRRSLRMVMFGEWTWLSNLPSWSTLPTHSPFNTYIFTLPYLFSHDPRAPRVFIAVLNILAVVLIYLTVQRYYGRLAATLAGLLLALSPNAVDWSRWVLNSNLAQVFIAAWLLTGLIGYLEGKRWAQITHWLMLSFAGQAHFGYGFTMAPLSLVFLGVGWCRFPDRRRAILWHTSIGWGLLALSLVPWVIGIAEARRTQEEHALIVMNQRATLDWVRSAFSNQVSSTGFWMEPRQLGRAEDWWPPMRFTDPLLWIKTWITFLGGLWLLLKLRHRRMDVVPGVMFALLMFWPITAFWASPMTILDYFLMPMMFGAYAVQGVVLAQLAQSRRWMRWPVFALVGLFLVLQGWIVVGIFRWFDVGGNVERYRASMETMLDALDVWQDESDHVVILTDTWESMFPAHLHHNWWEVLSQFDDEHLSMVAMPQGVPIYADGQVIAGSWEGTTIPRLFGEGEPQGWLVSGEPVYRKVVIPPDYHMPLDYQPETLHRFYNGIQIRGLHTLDTVQPGTAWPVVLVWSPERTGSTTQYQFSLRVMVGETTYGQVDGASLYGPLWPRGEQVVNLFEIPVAADLPLDADLRFQVIVYSWPDMASVPATDDDGNPLAGWLFLVPRTEPD